MTAARPRSEARALQLALHALLLALLAGQVLYLAGRHRVRADLTENQEYSLTGTTRTVLDGLDRELRVECYWSPVDDLSPGWGDARRELVNFLAELGAASGERVTTRRYDPSSDSEARARAIRLGIEPIPEVGSRAPDATSSRLVWQGLRLLYGADQQVVVDQVTPADCSPRRLQALLVPRIRELVRGDKPVVGYMEWPSPPGDPRRARRPMLAGWSLLRTRGDLAERYRWVDCRTGSGGFIPAEARLLVLFSPRRLDDRTKFAIDQFLLRGGSVLLYSDLHDYFLGAERTLEKRAPLQLDLPDTVLGWADQLAAYGIRLDDRVVSDRTERAVLPMGNVVGNPPQFDPVPFPYGFRCLGRDWSSQAETAARFQGELDAALRDRLREMLQPGLATDHPVLSTFAGTDSGPGFLWPHPVRVLDPLPDGVVGRELARTSALGVAQTPPPDLDALASRFSAADRLRRQLNFQREYGAVVAAALPTQIPVMAEVAGRFSSAFAGRSLPAGLVARKPVDADGGTAQSAENGAQGDTAPGGDRGAEDSAMVGPVLPEPQPEPEGEVVDFLATGTATGRLVVVGDSVALRDDVIGGSYNSLGGPSSLALGGSYILFTGLVDWLAGETDLMELRVRDLVDRRIGLVEREPGQDRLAWQLAVRARENTLAALAIGLPAALLLAIGVVAGLRRRAARARHSPVGSSPLADQPRSGAQPQAMQP